MTVRVRFAPSPTGQLHVGNLRTALLNKLYAVKHSGSFVLRFEDTDLEREVKGAEQHMIQNLEWMGLSPDESPYHEGEYGPYRTLERHNRGDYAKVVQQLMDMGRAYECYVSKEELDLMRKIQTSRGLPPGYDNRHRELSVDEKNKFIAEGRKPVIRFRLSDSEVKFEDMVRGTVSYDTTKLGGDPVIVRADGRPLFTLGGVVDDINQNITHVVRGEDHVTNTAIQVEIFKALGADLPKFAHLPLMMDSDGGKLSKRLDSLSLESLHLQGFVPQAINGYLTTVGTGVPPEAKPIAGLAEMFDFATLGRAPVRFDLEQVKRLNAMALHEMPWAEAKGYLEKMDHNLNLSSPEMETFWDAIKPNLTLLTEFKDQYDIVYGKVELPSLTEEDAAYLQEAEKSLPQGPYDLNTWNEWVGEIKTRTGRKGKSLFMPLRLALTGREHGPELGVLLPVMGEETVRTRLRVGKS